MRPDLVLCGVDASAAMLDTARARTRRAGTSVRLARCLAEDLDPARDLGLSGGFDAVYFSYVLSIIPEPLAALRSAWGLVRPGGVLAVVDFGDFSGLPAWFGKLLTAWLALFAVRPKPELAGQLTALADNSGARLVREDYRRGYAVLYWLRKPAA
jgi:S-adenosylmethionine-diacylgycerolhomoserine-N-methlytransferase